MFHHIHWKEKQRESQLSLEHTRGRVLGINPYRVTLRLGSLLPLHKETRVRSWNKLLVV